MAEESSEKKNKWWTWAWKALVALLVPIGALLAKDVYDYAKASLEAARVTPPITSKSEPVKPQQTPKPIIAEAVKERAKTLAEHGKAGETRPIVQDIISKNPLPLIMAAKNGQTNLVRMLLDRGADVNLRDRETEVTPLIVAAQQGHLQVVEVLLQKGADVSARDKNGKTALSEALRYQHDDVAKLLKEKGAR